MIKILLSGCLGAIFGSLLIIFFTILRDCKKEKIGIAREKLEKVYGPLIALKKKIDEVNQNEHGLISPSTLMEKAMIEKIIFNYYHLIDDDLKAGIILLHPDISKNTMSIFKNVQLNVTDKIIKHYKENKRILGLK